jgi:RNA polymerase sigma-70 factor (ECF subfamily)
LEIEEAFKRYRESMDKAMVFFSRDEEAAKDGVSQAFARALANKLDLEAMPEPAMKAWLYAAARNAVIDIKRRESRFSSLSAKTGDVEFADPEQPDLAGKITLHDLLSELPDPLRSPVTFKYFGNMNATEIGEAMKIPAATVRTRLRTALQYLRKQLT